MSGLLRVGQWLAARAENILAAMLGLMFVLFIVQIVFRYVLNIASGWAYEMSAILWIWIVLFGATFVLHSREEVRLDVVYSAVSPRVRRAMTVITSIALVALLGVALPAIVDYVLFMKIEETAYLDFRYDYVYSIFIAFVVVTIIRHVWRGIVALRGDDVGEEGTPQ